MKEDNVIQQKSFAFSVRIVKLYQHIVAEKKEFVLSKQLLTSGTSIGANVEDAIGGLSKADLSRDWVLPIKKHDKRFIGLNSSMLQSTYLKAKQIPC